VEVTGEEADESQIMNTRFSQKFKDEEEEEENNGEFLMMGSG